MRIACSALLFALLVGRAAAEDEHGIWLDGQPVALEFPQARTADGRRWIHVDDLRRGFGVVVKRLIPRPPEKTWRQPHRERDSWILCGAQRCVIWRDDTLGEKNRPTFDAARVARLLGYRVRTRAEGIHLTSPRGGGRPRAGRTTIGGRVGDVALPCLDGRVRRIGQYRGRRLLIVTWGSWSTVRDDLDTWRTAWPRRADAKLDLLFVAVDLEGEKYARNYIDVGFDEPVGIDRNADLARRLRFRDVGHWFLIDEVGLLRAEGEQFGDVERRWIDLHLEEPLLDVEPLPPPAEPAALDVLRRRTAEVPRDATARLALIEALERVAPAEARAAAAGLVALKPQSVPFAFRLARMQLDAGDLSAAVRVLDDARRRMPHEWVLRKQYWALDEPARFYSGEIDLDWQQKMRKEEAWLYRR